MPIPPPERSSRRAFLKNSFRTALLGTLPLHAAFADDIHGIVKPPRPLPDITVHCQDGNSVTLQSIVSGHATAIQLMFTTCTTTCPMQGAIFERVQKMLPEMKKQHIQLISLSVDPKADTPQALTEWLSMFHAGDAWIGAAPTLRDLAAMKSFFGTGSLPLDPHSTQTSILDRSGKLVYRSGELPPPEQLVAILRQI